MSDKDWRMVRAFIEARIKEIEYGEIRIPIRNSRVLFTEIKSEETWRLNTPKEDSTMSDRR